MLPMNQVGVGALLLAMLACLAGSACAQPAIELAQTPFDSRASVPPLLLLTLDVDESTLKSAWPDTYLPERVHEGYFHHARCYRPVVSTDGHFEIESDADASHACQGASYSGNFLNWATMTALDTLRHALSGGTRVVDTGDTTVLERVDVGTNRSVLASLRKSVASSTSATPAASPAAHPGRITPFNVPAIYTLSCSQRVLLSSGPFPGDCSNPGAGAHLLADLPVRIRVCDGNRDRRLLCTRYGTAAKPEGELQRAAPWLRIALVTQTVYRQAQATARFIGAQERSPPGWLPRTNLLAEWDERSGIAIAATRNDRPVLDQVNQLVPPASRRQRGRAYGRALDYLAHTGASDPVLASCQKNVILHIGGVTALAASVRPAAADMADANALSPWITRMDTMELDSSGSYGNPAPVAAAAMLEEDPDIRRAAALAYRANADSLRPGAPVRARTLAIDIGSEAVSAPSSPSSWPALRPFLLPAKYGGFEDANLDANPFLSTPPEPASRSSAGQIEWDRNGDGTPDSYQRAVDGEQLLRAVRSAFVQIARSLIEHNMPAVTAVALAREREIYLAVHEPRTWSGNIRRYQLTRSDEGQVTRADTASWESSIPSPSQRRIYTLGADSRGRIGTLPLDWDSLQADRKLLLNTSSQTGRPDGLGAQRVAWLHGDRQQEEGNGGKLRRRMAIMGDVPHGNLLWSARDDTSGAAALVPEPGQAAVASSAQVTTDPVAGVLYAGANDGLLHAFDAATGAEIFAYLPAALAANIPALTAPDYPHRAFVDGGIALDNLPHGNGRRTILTGSFGRGARGVFALDVSDPVNFAAGAGVMFEFTDSDDAAIGHVLGAPRVVRIATASAAGRSERAFVLAEAGVNSPAALFLIALDKAAGAWREGVNYFRISAASQAVPASSHLGSLALVNGEDGTLAHAWAGDAAGNLWRFSFTPDARTAAGFKADVTMVFKAINAQQLRQPITSLPRIAWASGSGYLVLFGTGKMLEHADAAPASMRQESLYAIHDQLAAGAQALDRARLASRRAVQHEDGSWRVIGDPFSYGGQTRGWVLDLPVSGELVLFAPILAGGRLHALTQVVAANPCLPIASRAWNVDVLSGLSDSAVTATRPGPALLRSPIAFRSGSAGLPDAFGRRSSSQLYSVLFQEPGTESGAPASVGSAVHKGQGPAGRLSWREIVDWKSPKESARAP